MREQCFLSAIGDHIGDPVAHMTDFLFVNMNEAKIGVHEFHENL